MNNRNYLSGYTLIEIMVSLVIASVFSISLYSVFVEGSKSISREDVLSDLKNYATNSLEIIAKEMKLSNDISIDNFNGSSFIRLKTTGQEEITYSIANNLICENLIPIKLPGYQWLINNQNLYDFEISLDCSRNNVLYEESGNASITDNTYDIEITIKMDSKIDKNYEETFRAHNRIFAINQFASNLDT